MHDRNNVPIMSQLRRRRDFRQVRSAAASEDLDVEIANLLAQGVPVEAEQFGGLDLIAARVAERGAHERQLQFAHEAMVEPGRRQSIAETSEISREIAFDR